MSSILKALKKVEEEKSGIRRNQTGGVNVGAEILKSDTSPVPVLPRRMALYLLLFIGGGGIVFYLLKQGTLSTNSPHSILVIPFGTSAQKTDKRTSASEIRTEQLPPAVEIVPARPAATVPMPISKPLPSDASGTKQNLKSATPAVAAIPRTATSTPPLQQPPVITARSHPLLTVDGIAFQDGNAENMAIINGVPVVIGSKIEGAVVEEIRKERVRFSYKGDIIEVSLGRSNRQPLR